MLSTGLPQGAVPKLERPGPAARPRLRGTARTHHHPCPPARPAPRRERTRRASRGLPAAGARGVAAAEHRGLGRSAARPGRVRARADGGGGRPTPHRPHAAGGRGRPARRGERGQRGHRRPGGAAARRARRPSTADDVDGAVAMNARFHAKIMELAGNAVLAELAAQVDRRVRWYYTPVARQRGHQSWIEHRGPDRRDRPTGTSSAPRELMREHTEHTRRSYHARERARLRRARRVGRPVRLSAVPQPRPWLRPRTRRAYPRARGSVAAGTRPPPGRGRLGHPCPSAGTGSWTPSRVLCPVSGES